MINFEGYHGTDNAHVGNILTYGLRQSTGDDEWLGDGTYFFLKGKSTHPEVQAEQWAVLSAWDKNRHANKYSNFSVLKAEITVEDSYLLDLSVSSGLEVFEYVKSKCCEKLKHISKRLKIIDGYLINFARNEIGLRIDAVKGDVYIKLTKADRVDKIQSRIANSTICAVHNPETISGISVIKTGSI